MGILKKKDKTTEIIEETVDKENTQIDSISKYFCTVNKPFYLLSITLSVTILTLSNNVVTDAKQMWLTYVLSMILSIVMLWLSYFVGKETKSKKNKLVLKNLTVVKKSMCIMGSVAYSLLVTMVIAIIMTFYLMKYVYRIY